MKKIMTKKEVDVFEKIYGQLLAVYEEMSVLGSKKPADALNKFKLKFVNALLSQANSILGNEYKPFHDFTLFDEVDIPSNSDAVFIVAQYMNCLEKLKTDNVFLYQGTYFWEIKPEKSDVLKPNGKAGIETTRPKTYRDK